MHSHAIEITAIEAALQQGQTRLNLYAGIHKALRAFMTDTLQRLGRADPQDDAQVRGAAAQLLDLVELFERHVAHENGFIHPAIEARCPGVSQAVGDDHVEHLRHIAELRTSAAALMQAPAAARAEHLYSLYLGLALFVADNLQHMHREETVHNAALWAAYSDEELAAIHNALVASIAPPEMLGIARWMLPALSAPERLALMLDLRGGAPEPFVEAVLDVARRHLSVPDWAALARGLGLAPVPGLVTA